MKGGRLGNGGFALVGAIFVLVVLAFLGAVMVKVSGVQSATQVHGWQGAQAYHAARSGLEWGIYRALAGASCNDEFDIDQFRVRVSCVSQDVNEGGPTYQVFTIASLAWQGAYGSASYVSRRVQGKVHNAP